jgi:hypothetical protein
MQSRNESGKPKIERPSEQGHQMKEVNFLRSLVNSRLQESKVAIQREIDVVGVYDSDKIVASKDKQRQTIDSNTTIESPASSDQVALQTQDAAVLPHERYNENQTEKLVNPTVEWDLSSSMREGIANFLHQLQKINPEFAKPAKHLQEKSQEPLDDGSSLKALRDSDGSVEKRELGIHENWENTFQQWSKPLSRNEQKLCGKAERAIRRAICKDSVLSKLNIGIFPQGSYRSGTGIGNSDADFNIYQWGAQEKGSQGFRDFQKFKKLVEEALIHKFGTDNIQRGNKVFNIHKNIFKVNVDILASFAYLRDMERRKGSLAKRKIIEIEFYRDDGNYIVDRPEEGYANKTRKHKETGRRFKKTIRILKNLREEMRELDIRQSRNVPSPLIEAMVYNVPNNAFGHKKITDDIKHILDYCIQNTSDDEKCKDWKEADRLRPVFSDTRSWRRQQAYDFLVAARDYIVFKLPT